MYVRQLGLTDFRSWSRLELLLEPGRTVFVGPNGFGKTNIVEALWYSSTLGSHRVGADAPLIRAGAERAIVSTIVVNEGRELAVDLEITAGRANKARLNRSPCAAPGKFSAPFARCCSPRRTWRWSAATPVNAAATSTSSPRPGGRRWQVCAPTTTRCCVSEPLF